MSIEENKALIRQWYELWNKGDMNGLYALHTNDVKDNNPFPGQPPGIEGLKLNLNQFHTAFPDMHIDVNLLVAEGDRVVDHVRASGTNQGELLGAPATGKKATIEATNIWRIANGKITEMWHVEDLVGMLQQLGAMPTPS
ncbi:MAG: ester cyclase [Chloroflexi bacterium]|nr:ester cyclase [Chloroflexota bacterium]